MQKGKPKNFEYSIQRKRSLVTEVLEVTKDIGFEIRINISNR